MGRLTTFSKLLITAVIIGAVFILFKMCQPKLKEQFGTASTETTTTTSSTGQANGSTSTSSGNTAASGSTAAATAIPKAKDFTKIPFNFTPPTPTAGKLKGVVELGASGFNSFIIKVDPAKNWKLEKADYGTSLVYEKLATDDDIRKGLKAYISDMLSFGVPAKDIHFVISSGAQKVDMTKKIIEQLKSMGYVVNAVTAAEEGSYALRCVQPKAYINESFVIDIGSGNTKISWIENGNIKALESYGAKYFQNGMDDAVVYADVLAKSKQIPTDKRKTCFIIGGVPFTMAKSIRAGKERFTVLNPPAGYANESDAKTKAGVNIYQAIADATGCQQFVFDWDSNFTIGFLLSL
jgi:hypothetical protein